MRYLRRFFFIPIILIVFLALTLAIYKEVRNKTIAQFNSEQIIIAKAASRGILDYMDDCKSELTFLSRFEGIIDFDDQGKELIKKYYENSAKLIEAITRIDPNGVIMATYPENNEVIGKNISNQQHIREMIESHKPVISDVFMSIQGYLAIAIHIPVFIEDEFKGSLAVLIAIDKIGKRYLENIRRGESGYAFLLSENNIEIYCPYQEHIGTSIMDVSLNDPTVLKLIEEIKKENFGSLNCMHDKSETLGNREKHVVFYRIPLGNTYWTILISIPKTEVYKTIAGFQTRLILLFSVLIFIILVYFYFFTKARTVLKEAAKRKTAERALIKSEEKYRLISGIASDYMFTSMLNDEGKIQLNWVAGAFEHITGYSLDEYVTLGGWGKTLHPDDLEKDQQDMESLQQNKKVITEVRTYHKNGKMLWVRVYANPIWNDKDKKLEGIYGAVQDITDQKLAEEKLKESEAYNRTLFNQSPIGLALSTMDGQLVDINTAFAKIIGRTIEETLKLSYWDITPKEYAVQEQQQLEALNTTGRYGPYVKEYIHKDGHLVPVRLLGLILERKGERFIWSSVEDISERTATLNALKQSEEKYRYLFENNPHSMWIYDLKTLAFLEVNKSAIVNYGYSREEFMKLTLNDIRPVEDLPALKKNIEQTTDEINNAGIWRHKKKNGEIIFVEIISSLIIFKNQEVRLVIASDVTERHNAELALKQSEAYNRTLFNQSPIGLALSTMDGQLVDINTAFAKIIGRTIEETLKLSFWDITPKEYAPQEDKKLEALNTTGRYGPYVKEYIHKNGYLVPVRLLGLIIERKGIPHIWSSVEDITESKKAEEKIKKLNEDLEEKVIERTKDLEMKISEIERMNKLFIDRELRMIELKDTIKALKAKDKRNLNN